MAAEAESLLSTSSSIEELASFVKAFGNSTRVRIVELLLQGEHCVSEITALIDVSQQKVSYHLAILRQSGFVAVREDGARAYYRIDEEHLIDALQAVSDALIRAREKQAERRPGDRCAACRESVQSKGKRRYEPRLRGRGTGEPEQALPSR
jgi:ArsR family transcriptional regulator